MLVLACFISALVAYILLTSPKRKKRKAERNKQIQLQILRLFASGERLTALEVGGRLAGSRVFVSGHLSALVDQKLLGRSTTYSSVNGYTVEVVKYFRRK